jgi:hypothetical protein
MSSRLDDGIKASFEACSPKDLLIHIWKAVPVLAREASPRIYDVTQKMTPAEAGREKERLALIFRFERFAKTCEVDHICTTFKEKIPAGSDHIVYPWDQPAYTKEGREWTLRLLIAALQLPNFAEGSSGDVRAYALKVKEEVTNKVTGKAGWDVNYEMAFKEAKGLTLHIPSK